MELEKKLLEGVLGLSRFIPSCGDDYDDHVMVTINFLYDFHVQILHRTDFAVTLFFSNFQE